MKPATYIRKNLINIPGWKTSRKIVVIESDDWGSIRMPSLEVYKLLLSKGIPVDKHYFLKNDCLESNDDLVALFEVLTSFRDKTGWHPVITANAVVANPDFDKIKQHGLKEYHFELIPETYKSYPNHDKVLELWHKHGIKDRLLWPQFHGREHLNVTKWMNAINSNIKQEKIAFDNKVLLGTGVVSKFRGQYYYMAACEYNTEKEKQNIEFITEDGLINFKDIFGFNARSFVASCAVQGDHLNQTLKDNGILYNQCGQHFIPSESGKLKEVNYFWGHKNKIGQIYWRRNATFEPSRNPHFDWVASCMKEIEIAFRWHKPAVINSHRVNYSGGIFEENRSKSLAQLKKLLAAILKQWPDTEFFTSDELGDLIAGQTR